MTTPVTPGTGQRVRDLTRLFAVLLLGLVIVEQVSLPWRLVGLLFGVTALVVGIRLLTIHSRLRRARRPAPGTLWVTMGLGLAVVILITLGSEAAFYPIVADNERCQAQASSIAATDACEQTYERRLKEILDRLQASR